MSVAISTSPASAKSVAAISHDDPIHSAVVQDNSTAPPHLHWIDALRGWAFLGVLGCHVSQRVGDTLPHWLGFWAANGRFGVQLFYIVSCLTLFMSLDSRSRREERPISAFFIRRLFRIAPLFWLAIIFYTFVLARESTAWAPHGVSAGDLASHFL